MKDLYQKTLVGTTVVFCITTGALLTHYTKSYFELNSPLLRVNNLSKNMSKDFTGIHNTLNETLTIATNTVKKAERIEEILNETIDSLKRIENRINSLPFYKLTNQNKQTKIY